MRLDLCVYRVGSRQTDIMYTYRRGLPNEPIAWLFVCREGG